MSTSILNVIIARKMILIAFDLSHFSVVVSAVVPSSLNSTLTSPSGVAGFLRTPAPDAPYLDDLHYTKNIVAAAGEVHLLYSLLSTLSIL